MNLVDLPHEVAGRLNVLDLEPLKGFRFAVQIDGGIPGSQFVAGFAQVQGISAELDVRMIREGGERTVHKFPRRSRDTAIVLRRGMTLSRKLWDWYLEAATWTKGLPDYTRSLSIFLLDDIAKPVGLVLYEAWRWDLQRAFISKWEGPRLDSMSDELAAESITVQHHGITTGKGPLSGLTAESISMVT